ncbi:tandem-type lipoprotein [Staphylococcus chromogenes]|uniref:tandem-type lipoprotein n=1 Tax=Staphylococcus chromogenes TaxID=46126 RepID=UPI0021D2D4D3|nr:tandem-type lipoprotein [Staphylococcus chromogenes]UXS67925.1 tandem-type lipoprotein [Staphylococcus chromogenes]
MKRITKLGLSITLATLTIILCGCSFMNKKNEIQESFEKSLGMYPVKNLEDFYDKEGYRDEEFNKNDKGTWVLYSGMSIQRNKGDALIRKAMVLHINRNSRQSSGEYIIAKVRKNNKGDLESNEEKYPVVLINNKIVPKEDIKDQSIKKEIENFKFFVQYAKFNDLNSYGQGDFDYNPNVPSYSAKYQLSNDNYNVKQLRKRYDIPTNKAPKLLLDGIGEIEDSTVGYKRVQIEFEENEESSIFYTDLTDFKPSEDVN